MKCIITIIQVWLCFHPNMKIEGKEWGLLLIPNLGSTVHSLVTVYNQPKSQNADYILYCKFTYCWLLY